MSIRNVFLPIDPSALPNPVIERTIVNSLVLKIFLIRVKHPHGNKNPSAEAEGNIWMG
jgi:hypothetical protein